MRCDYAWTDGDKHSCRKTKSHKGQHECGCAGKHGINGCCDCGERHHPSPGTRRRQRETIAKAEGK